MDPDVSVFRNKKVDLFSKDSITSIIRSTKYVDHLGPFTDPNIATPFGSIKTCKEFSSRTLTEKKLFKY